MKLQNKLLFFGLAAALAGGFVYSKIFVHQRNRKELKEIAYEIALTWREKLGLSMQQTLMLEDIIIIYTIKKNAIINSDIPEFQKILRLKKVQFKEHKDLKKVLSETQFENYVGINKKIPNSIMDSLPAS